MCDSHSFLDLYKIYRNKKVSKYIITDFTIVEDVIQKNQRYTYQVKITFSSPTDMTPLDYDNIEYYFNNTTKTIFVDGVLYDCTLDMIENTPHYPHYHQNHITIIYIGHIKRI